MQDTIQRALRGATILDGKSAVITGAAAGIGRACAELFAGQGSRLALVDVDGANLDRVCAAIRQSGGRAQGYVADVTSEGELQRALDAAIDSLSGIDILVNNAGGGRTTPFFKLDRGEWEALHALNVTSAFLASQRAARVMVRQRAGAIVNVASIAGRSTSITAGCHYTAAKAALLGLTRHLARELAPHNVRVNAVCPGVTNSDRIVRRLVDSGTLEEVQTGIPLGRLGDVSEIAACCLFLASDLAGYVTGASLDANGGVLMI